MEKTKVKHVTKLLNFNFFTKPVLTKRLSN